MTVTLADLHPRVRAQVAKVAHAAAQRARAAKAIAKVDPEEVGRKAAKVPGWKGAPKPLSSGEEAFRLHCRARLPAWSAEPLREYRFFPGRQWRFDFAWPAYMVAVEVEGITPAGGRHQRPKGFVEDCRKYNAAAEGGWRVFRFTTHQVRKGEAIEQVFRVLGALDGTRDP